MKLQKLTIHNIASIEDATIDFEAQPLADSEVFLITGKTGAGKSTILDAICLALFANTPRLKGTQMEGETKDGNADVTIKDPRQLMRRNTGEAFVKLTFTGSNGVHYEATWSVKRAYNKVTGNLRDKVWQLKNLDTDYIVNKVTEINQEIKVAIGLDFNQFCRTTLLAQGEFTRFLNSKDDEKAAILEKITGVDVYARIGKKVFEITGRKEQLWRASKQQVEGIRTLSDEEIAAKKEEMAGLDAQYKSIKDAVDADKAKLQWIRTDADLTKAMATATEEHQSAQAVVESDDFRAKELLVKQWNATIDARNWLKTKKNAENSKTRLQKALSALESDYVSVLNGYAFAEQEKQQTEADIKVTQEAVKAAQETFDKQEAEMNVQEEALAALRLNGLREQRDKSKELIQNIHTAFDRIESLGREKERKQMAAKALVETLAEIENKKKELERQEPQIHDAKVKMDACKEMLDKQSDTVNKFAKTLRQKLHIGDICPVCRQEIKSGLPHEEELAKLVGGLSDAFKEAEAAYKKLDNEKNRLEAEIKTATKNYQTAKEAFDKDKAVETAEQKVVAACKACGIEKFDDDTPTALGQLKEKADAAWKELGAKIAEGESKDSAIKELRKAHDKFRVQVLENKAKRGQELASSLNEMTRTCQMVKEVIEEIGQLMPAWHTLTASEKSEQAGLIKKANDVKGKTAIALEQLKQAEDIINANGQLLEDFLGNQSEINVEILSALNGHTSQQIGEINSLLEKDKKMVVAKKTLMDEAGKKLDEHRQAKPELNEEDTIGTLEASIREQEPKMAGFMEKKGAVNQVLKTDEENKKKVGKLIEEVEKRYAEYQKWSRLNQLIGDSTGNKFRKIAQSYVLTSLIHSANYYMKTLTDRYTLKVAPGTFVISLEDAYQGYVSRAASTISGGESFLVSLSLALALSDIGQQLAVDTLFVDEGFGTLSGEPLQNAINTLRSLHTKSGRHVGIISHVEELQERIPIQIQVIQERNNSSSSVKVVSF